ncbi:hypothetical protein TIFTF001_030003 [Ficus carica]|uniref:Uncharacterized protein n=1 Tax=Ficus carica TaxID=3494 RepID=A0AA88DSE4_FICCA|nr:hypothetical protein TIFTF001_030003 [Ficus carica]
MLVVQLPCTYSESVAVPKLGAAPRSIGWCHLWALQRPCCVVVGAAAPSP